MLNSSEFILKLPDVRGLNIVLLCNAKGQHGQVCCSLRLKIRRRDLLNFCISVLLFLFCSAEFIFMLFLQLEMMQQNKVKAEIQALAAISPDFLSSIYLPNKLRYGGWL